MKITLDREKSDKYHYRHIAEDGMFNGTIRSYNTGDKVLVREWNPNEIYKLSNLDQLVFIIKSKGKEFTRQITNFDEFSDMITCEALNSNYGPFNLFLEDISELYIIVKLIDKKHK